MPTLRYALRQLGKTPVFTTFVILTLALGIGANTAIFSVMNAVLLRMLPVHQPEQLVFLTHNNAPPDTSDTGRSDYSFGINVYDRLRQDHSALSEVIAFVPLAFNKTAIRIGDSPEEARAEEVSGNFFTALGIPMVLGQAFTSPDEEHHASLAVLSYGFWTRRFHRDPAVLGQTVFINGVPFTVLGVAGSHFVGVDPNGTSTDLWVPLQRRPEITPFGVPATGSTLYGDPNWWTLMLLARLQPGVTPVAAAARLNPLFSRAAYETHGAKSAAGAAPLSLNIIPARGLGLTGDTYRQPLHILMGMVALVLLIACVNIVMLLAARNAAREREFSLRLALGARRWPLLQQLLAESVLLVLAGVTLGWLFALAATRALATWSQLEVSLAPDHTVLLFTLTLAGVATLLFGLAPLRAATRAPVSAVLTSSSPRTGIDRGDVLAGRALVIGQISLCIALLFAAGLLIRTLQNYRHIDLGLHADRVLAFGVHPSTPLADGPAIVFYNELLQQLSALPGVSSVTLAENRPGTGWSDNNNAVVDGRTYAWEDGRNDLRTNTVGPWFFRTLGIPVTLGRELLPTDTAATQRVAVVNQTFVDQFFHGASPLGHTLGNGKHIATIVGVVRNSKYTSADETSLPMAWASFQQLPHVGNMDVELSSTRDPLALLPAIRQVVHRLDPNAPLADPRLLQSQFEDGYLMPALFARLATFFGLLAALLVAIGLYGTLSFRTGRRTVEIGVRMAVGAARLQVLWMVLREGLLLTAAGLLIGLPLTWFGATLMTSMLYNLPVHDPVSFLLATLVVLAISLAAALIPARRAAGLNPMQALRAE